MNYSKFTLLIVDDDDAFREALVLDFKKKGYRVLAADSGSRAFSVIRENPIDLILSDISMPCGDGISMLDELRANYPAIPTLIFLTGHAEASQTECLQKGAFKVLKKPFDRSELQRAVENALRLSVNFSFPEEKLRKD